MEDRWTGKDWYRHPPFPGGVRLLSLLIVPKSQDTNQSLVLWSKTTPQTSHRLSALPCYPVHVIRGHLGIACFGILIDIWVPKSTFHFEFAVEWNEKT
jgi:hypothetical protein